MQHPSIGIQVKLYNLPPSFLYPFGFARLGFAKQKTRLKNQALYTMQKSQDQTQPWLFSHAQSLCI